jgi:hypothetical protein
MTTVIYDTNRTNSKRVQKTIRLVDTDDIKKSVHAVKSVIFNADGTGRCAVDVLTYCGEEFGYLCKDDYLKEKSKRKLTCVACVAGRLKASQ